MAQTVDYNNSITGDESWIYYENPPHYFWGKDTDAPPVVVRKQQHDKKTMLVIMVPGFGLLLHYVVPDIKTVDTSKFLQEIILCMMTSIILLG